MIDPISARIPELDRLIDEKLATIAECIGRERGMADFKSLPEQQEETLLDDAFEKVAEWEAAAQVVKVVPPQKELQRLLQEHHELTQEMLSIHREIDRLDRDSN